MNKELTQRQRDSLERQCRRWEANLGEAAAYLEGRGFTEETAVRARLGVVDEPLPWNWRTLGRLSIPYITRSGVVDIRYRCIRDCNDKDCPKYLGEPGQRTRIYNVGAVLESRAGLSICEGELDALTLIQCGIPAVGLPGARSWKGRYERVLEDGAPFTVWADGDIDGREFAEETAKALRDSVVIRLPDGMDVNSAYMKYGEDWIIERHDGGERTF